MEIRHKKRSVLSRLSAWVFKIIGNSFIGRFFKSYDKANTKFVKNNVKNGKNYTALLSLSFENSNEKLRSRILYYGCGDFLALLPKRQNTAY